MVVYGDKIVAEVDRPLTQAGSVRCAVVVGEASFGRPVCSSSNLKGKILILKLF